MCVSLEIFLAISAVHFVLEMKKTGTHSVFNVIAMIRPRTVRRNAVNTLEVALRLAYNYPHNVKVTLFGCNIAWLNNALKRNMKLRGGNPYRPKKFPVLKNVEFQGLLVDRVEIANLYRRSDIFIDLSWWQAFGRTAMEAMASGVVSIMPQEGSSSEICKEGKYCLSHDGNDIDGYYDKIVSVIKNDKLRKQLITRGQNRVKKFVTELAAASIAHQLKQGYAKCVLFIPLISII